jgi:hypothetical protein
LLARTRDGHVGETCTLQLLAREGQPRKVHAAAGTDTVAGRFLLALMVIDPADPASQK